MTIKLQPFPVTLRACWQEPSTVNFSVEMQSWLLDPSSLTVRLSEHCQTFHVEVLGQHITQCEKEESTAEIPTGCDVLVREVLLYCDNVPHVFARSLLPLSSLTGEEKKLAKLGNQSLGQVLFNSPSLVRKSIEVSLFNQTSSVGQLSKSLFTEYTLKKELWGRRSVFLLNKKPIMVSEVFLPPALAYQNN